MVRQTAISLASVAMLAMCSTDMREIEICKLDVANNITHCAKAGVQLPEAPMTKVQDWYSVSEADLRKIADKLEECENQKSQQPFLGN